MKIGVSACLMGRAVRYDGKEKGNREIQKLLEGHETVLLCPETAGGLPVPRVPSERKNGRVYNAEGNDVTAAYLGGSSRCLSVLHENGIRAVVLKAKSPACGVHEIYDGTFTGTLKKGEGTFAEMCRNEGILLFDENDTEQLKKLLEEDSEGGL